MNDYFATVGRGLEAVASRELESLGAQKVSPAFAGVHFSGDQRLLYRVNLWGRTLFRVLVPLRDFRCVDATMLYEEVQKIDWRQYLQLDQTLAVHCTGTSPALNHTHFTALQVKNAIVDQQRSYWGKRSHVDPQHPDLLIQVHLHQDRCTLSLDSSGTSLHRRGYRPAMGLAPLKETLAAGLLELANYDPNLPFFDPMCGSGILPIEASLKALNWAPGLFQEEFAFMKWPDFDPQIWDEVYQEAKAATLPTLPSLIMGSDQDSQVLSQARINAQQCDVGEQIQFYQRALSDWEAPAPQGLIICNPPYGKRLGNEEELGNLYQELGDVFKQRFKGWTAFILTGNKALSKRVGLRTSGRVPVYNGGLPCTLLKYELY